MAVHYIRPNLAGELRDPFDCDEQAVKALVTVGAFVALADGHLDAIERDEAVRYIDRQQLAPPSTGSGSVIGFRCGSNRRTGRCGGSTRGSQRGAGDQAYTADCRDFTRAESRQPVYIGDFHPSTGARKMKRLFAAPAVSNEVEANATSVDDWRLERLLNRLPKRVRSMVRFVRQPSARWLRIPTGVLLAVGGTLWFLPIAGLWMLPIGLALLADDVRPLRSLRSRTLDWIEHHRPDWLAHGSREQ
jgi:hypothetical protein